MDEVAIRTLLVEDPGNEKFVELAEQLRERGASIEAVEVCLAGLSANPSCYAGRLELARLFYQLGYIPFAAREINELRSAYPASPELNRLAQLLGAGELEPTASRTEAAGPTNTVAEAEFDSDDMDLIDSEDEPK